MSQVIAFWNISPWDDDYYQGQLIGTVTVEGEELIPSPADSVFLNSMIQNEGNPKEFVDRYSDYASMSGTGSRLLKEGEEPKDLVYNKYVVSRHVPGKGIVTDSSYTIDGEGVWNNDAEKS